MPALLKKSLLAVVIAYAASLPLAFFIGGLLFMRPIREPLGYDSLRKAMDPSWDLDFLRGSREVKIAIAPHVHIAATILGGDSHGAVLVLHASGGNRTTALNVAYEIWRQNLDVVLIDRRAHGSSDGDSQPLFADELDSLEKVVDTIVKENWVGTSTLGVCGIGDAGTSALLLAAKDDRIDAAAALDPVADARDFVAQRFASLFHLPQPVVWPHAELAVRAMALFSDSELRDFRVGTALSGIAGRALVVGQGSRQMQAAARSAYSALPSSHAEFTSADSEAEGFATMAAFLGRIL